MAKNPRNQPAPPTEPDLEGQEEQEDERDAPNPERVAKAKKNLQKCMTRLTHALADGKNASLKALAVRAVRAGLPYETLERAFATVQESLTDAVTAAEEARDTPRVVVRGPRTVSRVDRIQL